MQTIDLNAELERLHKSLQEAKSENVAMSLVTLIGDIYEIYRDQERDSDTEIFNHVAQRDKEETERAAPAIKEMIKEQSGKTMHDGLVRATAVVAREIKIKPDADQLKTTKDN